MNDLILHKLTLCNFFGIYGTAEYDLLDRQGLIGFIGNNGSNKSNTLLGIPFALYGELPKENLRDLINTTALAEDPEKCVCEVSLTLSMHKDIYVVSRTISADEKMTSRLEINGKLFSRKRGEVDDKIIEILGMDLSTAQLTIFSEQGNVDKFFALPNPEKKEFIDNLIGVKFKEHFDALKKRVAFFEKRQLKMANVLGVYNSQKKDLNDSLLSLRVKIADLKDPGFDPARLKAVETELASYKDFESTKEKLDSSKKQLSDLSDAITTLEKQNTDKTLALATLRENKEKIKYTKVALAKLPRPTEINTEQLTELSLKSKGLAERMSALNLEIKSGTTEVTQIVSEISSLDKSLKEDICYVCHKPGIDLKEFNEKKSALVSRNQVLDLRISELKESLLTETTEEAAINKQILELKEKKSIYDKDLATYNSGREKRQAQVSSAKVYRSNKRNATLSLFTAKNELTGHTATLLAKKEELSPRIQSLQSLIETYTNALGASPEKYKELTVELIKLNQAKVENDNVVLELSKYKTLQEKDQQVLERVLKKIEKITRIKLKIEEKLTDFPILKKHIETKFILFVQKSLSRISSLTNQILKDISSPIEIRLILEETAKSSSVRCHYMKDQIEVPKISGGQRVVLGICFRIALWKYLSIVNPGGLSFMILDEVLVQLNADSANAAFNQIKGLKKYFKYIFMTSHTDHIWNVDHTFKFGE